MPKVKGRPLERACDACYTRRVKCSKTEPCDHCIRLKITCTYQKAKEGKKTTGKRIELLRHGGTSPTADAGGAKPEDDGNYAETSFAGAARMQGQHSPYPAGGPSSALAAASAYSTVPQLPPMRDAPGSATFLPPPPNPSQHFSPGSGSSGSTSGFHAPPYTASPDYSRAPYYAHGTPSAGSPRSMTSPHHYRQGSSASSRYPPIPPGAPYPPPSLSDRPSPSLRSNGYTPGSNGDQHYASPRGPPPQSLPPGRSEMYPPHHPASIPRKESYSRAYARLDPVAPHHQPHPQSHSQPHSQSHHQPPPLPSPHQRHASGHSEASAGVQHPPMGGGQPDTRGETAGAAVPGVPGGSGSSAPMHPAIFPPSFSQPQATMGMGWQGTGSAAMPMFRLPGLQTSLADNFNAQDPSNRAQFLDWSVLMEQINHTQMPDGGGDPAAGANSNDGNGPGMGRRQSLSTADLFTFDMSGNAPNMFESLSAPLANFPYASSNSADTPGSRTSGMGMPFDSVPNLHAGNDGSGGQGMLAEIPSAPASTAGHTGTHPLSDSILIPRIATFFERLHPALPVFSRSWIFSRLDKGHQHTDEHFSSMLLAMSALVLIQPVEGKEGSSIKARMLQARQLLDECVRMRNHVLFGKRPTLESTMTSFYIFACLFGMREDNAAWFRLHEAVCVGHLLKLHEPSAYESLERDEQERRLRAYWLLAITERAYALQRGHSLGFRGHPLATTNHLRKKFKLNEFDDFPNLQLKLFDYVDEVFLDCWNGRCRGRACKNLNTEKAIRLYESFMEDYDKQDEEGESEADKARQKQSNGDKQWKSEYERKKVQKADLNVTRQWLLNRLWLTCLSHGLISVDSPHQPLKADHAVDIARRTLRIVEKLTMPSMEAHGIGFAEKLYDIAMTLIVIYKDFPVVVDAVQPLTSHSQHSESTLPASNMFPSPAGASPQTPSFGQLSSLHAKDLSSVHAILQAYVEFMQKFRSGEHPFLKQLVDAIKSLPQRHESSFESILAELGVI